jgi:hypothetical protein
MKQQVTSNAMIQLVLERTTGDFRLQLYETSMQKGLFWAAVSCVVASAVCGAVSYFVNNGDWALAGIRAFLVGAMIALAYQGTLLWAEVQKLKNPEKEIASPLTRSFSDSMELIHELSTFEAHHLKYAQDLFRRNARHLRERISLFVGALDKVGAIPLAVTAYLSYAKMSQGSPSFGAFEAIGLIFSGFYLFAIRMSMTAQWMEGVSELFEHAWGSRVSRDAIVGTQLVRAAASPSVRNTR